MFFRDTVHRIISGRNVINLTIVGNALKLSILFRNLKKIRHTSNCFSAGLGPRSVPHLKLTLFVTITNLVISDAMEHSGVVH
jgi:hypothetical protein